MAYVILALKLLTLPPACQEKKANRPKNWLMNMRKLCYVWLLTDLR